MGFARARRRLNVRSLTILGMAMLAAGCSGTTSSVQPSTSKTDPVGTTTSKTVGSGGGTLGTSSGNAAVAIPPGAVAGSTSLTIAVVAASQAPATSAVASKIVSSVYDFSPNGTQFAKPVSMALRTTEGPAAGQKAVLAYLDHATNSWQVVPNSTYDASTSTVSAPISHFTIFAVILVAADGTGCSEQIDPNAYCAPLMCSTTADKCAPIPSTYVLGGSVSGLSGTVGLTDAAAGTVTVAANGNFVFPNALAATTSYSVQVAQQPPGQICTVNFGQGQMAAAAVSNIVVSCQSYYAVSGAVSGMLDGASIGLANGNDTLTVAGNTDFVFATSEPSGAAYLVTVATQPNYQTCTVANANGLLANANVTNVAVGCINNTYALGGHVSGLRPGVTVALSNGGDVLNANTGAYTFAQPVAYGSNYNVTIAAPAGYSCAFNGNVVANANMAGQAVTSVDITCALFSYTVGGRVSGLVGNTLVTLNNGIDTIFVANGNYVLPTALHAADPYDVSISSPPGEDCAFDFNVVNNGNMPAANIADVNVVCAPLPYQLGVSVAGLVLNANLSLTNGSDTLQASNGNIAFATAVAYGASYSVTFTSPTGQTCSVGSGLAISGTMPAHNANVVLTCAANTYSINANVSGLVNGAQVSLSSGNDTPTTGNGNMSFATAIAYGSAYSVSLASPPGETCQFAGGGTHSSGTMGVGALALAVNCTPISYSIGGLVTGLVANANVTLHNGSDTVSTYNSAYMLPTEVAFGATYAATLSAPSGQSCAFSGAPSGIMGAQNITTFNVVCSPNMYLLGGSVAGLAGGANVTLTNNGQTINAVNGSYTFPTPVAYNSNYAIALGTPTGHSCAFATSGNGTMGVGGASVAVNCNALHFAIGGTVSGLVGSANVTLTNGADSIQLANGSYSFATSVAYGSAYSASVTSPTGQSCSYTSSPSGTVGAANVTLSVACAPRSYSLFASVVGLVSNTNVVLTNGADTLNAGNGNTPFATQLAYNSNYAVGLTSPTAQTCTFATTGNGTVGAANVTVAISCVPNTFAISGSVTNLIASTNVTIHNGNDTLSSANGSYALPTSIAYGANYNVILTSPMGQTCTTAVSPYGTMGASALTVNINCTTNSYTLFTSVSGLVASASVVLTNNVNADTLTVSNGNSHFPLQVAFQGNYAISAAAVTGQSCVVASPNGTLSNANVTVAVTCTPKTYALSGTIAGLLANTSLTVQNGADSVSAGNGGYVMPQPVAYNSNYSISYVQPVGQTCTTSNGNNTVSNANVTNININCQTNSYTIRGVVTGLVASANVTLVNGAETQHVVNGNYAFATPVPYQGSYNISVTPPMGQNCNVVAGEALAGVMSVGDINVAIACQPNTYSVGGSVQGLVTAANVTIHNGSDFLSMNNGSYVLATLVPFASNYAVTVTSATGQTCLISNANGTMGVAAVANANIQCTPNAYSLVGSVSGLVAGQVTLMNGADSFGAGNGSTLFPTAVIYNGNYAVTYANPTGQHCSIASPNGVMGGGNTSVAVVCSPNTYSIAGAVTGLINNGNVVMYNGSDHVSLYNGAYTMPTLVAFNSNYAISATAPAGQICSLSGSPNVAVMGAANVTGVNATCSQLSYHVVGHVSGLVNNGNLLISNGADTNFSTYNGNYTLPTQVIYNGSYAVSLTSPAGQTCVASGTPLNGNIVAGPTAVNIGCTQNPYQVGGSIIGLITNTNVTIYNGNDTLSATNGNYVMPTPVKYYSSYAFTLAAPAGQLCTFGGNPNGVMQAQNVTSVEIDCQPATYTIGGVVSGLVTGMLGLSSGSDNIQAGNGNYSLPTQVAYQSSYAVSITSPVGQNCNVSSGAANGTMGAGGAVLNIACLPKTYALGGRVSGLLANTNVTLYNGNDVVMSPNGVYTMPTAVAYYANYNVTLANPVGQTCSLNANHAGTMLSHAVVNANVTCVPNSYTLAGSASGLLNGATVAVHSGADNVSAGNANFTLPSAITYQQTYSVTLVAPSGHTCTVSGGAPASAVMGAASIGNITVHCMPISYTVGGNISGLVSATTVTVTSANDTLTVGNGDYNMPVPIAYASNYNYTVAAPSGQNCNWVTSGNTTLVAAMSASSVHNANLVCAPIPYVLGGSVSGLLPGTAVTLTSGGDSPALANSSYTFATPINYAATYSVSLAQPLGQNCSFVGNGNTGTMPASAVGNVNVTCVPFTYTLGGHVAGLLSNANVVVTNGADSVSLYNGAYAFPTSVAYTSAYSIGITSPAGQSCQFNSVGAGNGNMTAASLTNRDITCAPIPYNLGGLVVGLLANTNVTLYNGNDNVPAGNGNYVFPTPIAYASNYNVTLANPTGHTCVFGNANNANMIAGGVSNLNVNCTVNPYAVGGTVTGLVGAVVLANGNDTLSLSSTGAYLFAASVSYHGNYNVTVQTQPGGQICTVSGATGTVQAANVTTVNLACVNAYSVAGVVTGLPVDSNIRMVNALGTGSINVSYANPNFIMPQIIANTGNYNVQIARQPPGLLCTASNNSGVISGGNVTNVTVGCTLQLSFYENQSAVMVVGQPNLLVSAAGTSSTTLRGPSGPVYMAANGNVYVSDTGNKRVIGFAGRPTANGQAASFVIGQTDFNTSLTWSPNTPRANTDAAQGGAGNGNVTAFVDSYSSRVLLYPGSPNSNISGTIALGQPDLVTGTAGCSASKLNGPAGAWVNNSNFIVADTKNHRVLIWLTQPASSGASADMVLGQPDMVTCGLAASPDANNFSMPQGVWSNGAMLVVADTVNNRVLVWSMFPSYNQQPASSVIGQPDVYSNDPSDPTTTMYQPASVVSDGVTIFVAERYNSRVSEWGPIGSAALEFTLGQADISGQQCNAGASASANHLCNPSGISIIGTSLYVTDYGNNRVVVYKSN